MTRPLIVGNWKMYKNIAETQTLINVIKAGVHTSTDVEVAICPPFTTLAAASEALKDSKIDLGAQDMYFETEGAYTGEVSPLMLKDVGCRYVILGHSERRTIFHESDELVQKKLIAALKYSFIPIVCIGETLEEREARQAFEVVKRQLDTALSATAADDIDRIVLAYEPVWAIGTGRTATPEQAEQMHSYIRRLLNEKYGEDVASKVRILYGGSVKPDNISQLMSKPNLDGALVGGASIKAESFIQIVQNSLALEPQQGKQKK